MVRLSLLPLFRLYRVITRLIMIYIVGTIVRRKTKMVILCGPPDGGSSQKRSRRIFVTNSSFVMNLWISPMRKREISSSECRRVSS